MNKTRQLAAALAFVLAVISTTAAAAETDISGAWIITLDLVASKATIEANIKQDDDKLLAEVNTPAGKLDFNGTLVNNRISAVYTLRYQANILEVRMNGVAEGESLSGTIEFGRGKEVKWTAVRKPVVAMPETAGETPLHDSTEIPPEAPK